MGRPGRPVAALILQGDEQAELERLTKRAAVNRQIAFRARLLLACAGGMTNTAVARRYRTTNQTVGKWRKRFIEERLEGLYDEPRPGAPRSVTDAEVEAVLVKTLEEKPKGRTHWSTRSMAENVGLSHTTIGRVWRTFGLKPHVARSFKISDDPQFVDKVRDVVGLYMNPPDHAVVFSFDEKSQVQALERAQPILPMDLGQPERQTHNYLRHGTLDLFAALNVATGKVIASCKKQHRARDFVAFLATLDQSVEPGLEVHVVLDNLSAHKAPVVHRWLLRHPRFVLHFTPTYSSWLNLVERFFGLLTQHALQRGSHTSVPELRRAITAYVDAHNERGRPFKWTKSADEILAKVQRFGLRTQQAHRPRVLLGITDPGD
ncbi:MAG TPA: IS630 family transposase [Polyangiales bacterium]|nr:IS630 family transposase [Polyangiales bacterium]